MDTGFILQVLACLIAACGIFLLQAAWRARSGNALRLVAGWGAVLISIVTWASTSHPDKGSALGVLVLVIVALLALGWSYVRAERRSARETPERAVEQERPGAGEITRRAIAALLIGPVAGLSALSLAAAGYVALHAAGLEPTANLVIAMFAFPLLWAGLAVAAGASSRLWRKSLIVLAAGLAPLAYLTIAS